LGLKWRSFDFSIMKLQKIVVFLTFLFCVFSLTQHVSAQIQDEDEAIDGLEERLADKEISEEEITKRLKQKGIDVDQLSPGDLPVLESTIQTIIKEIEQERKDSADLEILDENNEVIEAPEEDGIETNIEKNVQSIVDERIGKTSSYDAANIMKRVKKGLSLEEAISEYYSEKLMNEFSISTEIWGHDIFFNKTLSVFNTVSSSTTPDSYVLDEGDELAVNIFGISQTDLVYSVDEDGFIRPEKGTKVYVKGLTLNQAKRLIERRFSQFYMFSSGQFNVSLVTARTIKVTILGEVNRSGSYTISALNSAINAIMAAGGPKPNGSIREIQILSDGKKRILDVYDYMYNLEKAEPIYLHDDDVIFIPPQGKIVEATGDGFKHQAKYELKADESFNDLIRFAGGLKYNAYVDLVNHEFFRETKREIKSYTFQEASNKNIRLGDGDIISIKQNEVSAQNFIQVSGGVLVNDKFQWSEGMRFSDAIKLGVVQDYTYMDFAYLKRINEDETYQILILSPTQALNNQQSADDPVLKPQDVVTFFNKSDFQDSYFVSINGAVRNPLRIEYSRDESVLISDMINIAQGLTSDAAHYGILIRRPTNGITKSTYEIFNVKEAVNEETNNPLLILEARDSIYIPRNSELFDQQIVEVGGAVKRPNKIDYSNTLTLEKAIALSGGFEYGAAFNRIDVYRLTIKEGLKTRVLAYSVTLNENFNPIDTSGSFLLEPNDFIAVRYAPEFEQMRFVQVEGEVLYPGTYAILKDNETIADIISRAGGPTNEAFLEGGQIRRNKDNIGYIVANLKEILKDYNSEDNIILDDGDIISIPKKLNIVFIEWEATKASDLYNADMLPTDSTKLAVNYKKKDAKWYVNTYAGGYSKGAKRSDTKVLTKNGQILRTKSFLFLRNYPTVTPGATVITSFRPRYLKRMEKEDKPESEKRPDGEVFEQSTKLLTVLTGVLGITSQTITTIAILNQTK
jgi:protein involved in polysaccharide export with SLBB domain